MCRWNAGVNSIPSSVLTGVSQALPWSQGAFLKDAPQAAVCQDNTLYHLWRWSISSFTSDGKGREIGGKLLCSLLFLKPRLEITEKSVSQLFFPDSPIVLDCVHSLPNLYRKKNLQWKREYLKHETKPTCSSGEDHKQFSRLYCCREMHS